LRKVPEQEAQIHIENGPLLHVKFDSDTPRVDLEAFMEIWKKRHVSIEILTQGDREE
jgi:hypothetical protein